jgi:DnaJ like chaperone protein
VAAKDDPYLILGVRHDAPEEEIRRRYRQLVRENHPDRHIAAGVPEEMIAIATGRLQTVNEAYDRIMKEKAV